MFSMFQNACYTWLKTGISKFSEFVEELDKE